MGEYQHRETVRVMGYRFDGPSSRGMIVRAPTPEERVARDTSIEMIRDEQGALQRSYGAQARSAAAFAAARVNASAALARCARLRKGSGKSAT